jgi:hypothetical protein
MNKTIVILACCTAISLIAGPAFAQGKPAEPAAAAAKPAAAAAKPAAAAAKPAAAPAAKPEKPAAAKADKPAAAKPEKAEKGEKPGKPAEPGAKPGVGPAAAAAGAAPAMPPKPKPPAELEENFKYFIGNWRCETTFPAGAMGPGSAEVKGKSTVKFKKAIGGWYIQGDYAMQKTKTTPSMKGTFMISYQPAAKTFVSTSTDDMGSAVWETSSGFSGDTITLVGEGYMMGQKAKVRETMTRMPDTKGASHKYEVDMGKGFQVMGEDLCKR